MSKKGVGVIFGIMALFALPFGLLSITQDTAKAENVSSLFIANVSSVISQSVTSCGTSDPNTAALENTGAAGDHFSSCYVVVNTTTNAPGYNLMIQSIDGPQRSTVDGDNNWLYDTDDDGDVDGADNYAIPYGDGMADGSTRLMQVVSENTPPTLPTLGSNYIEPTDATMLSPAEMNASVSPYKSVWGFAVPKTQSGSATSYFDNSYSTYSSSGGSSHGKYAKVPTNASSIRLTSLPVINDPTDVFFGASVSPTQPPGVYKGVVVFTSVANPITSSAPAVAAIYPDNGLPSGGTTADVYGAYFVDGTTVAIGGSSCDSVQIVSSSHLTCVVPAKSVGSYPVVATTVFGQSNSNILYTYTESPTPTPNPYSPSDSGSGDESISPFFASEGASTEDVTNGSIEPQGRSVFENLADAVGDTDYNNLWLAIGGGALLACLLVILSVLLGRKWDIYITKELGGKRAEVVKILVEKVGLDAKEVVASLQTMPSLVVKGVSAGDAKKILALLLNTKAEASMVRHKHGLDDGDSDK